MPVSGLNQSEGKAISMIQNPRLSDLFVLFNISVKREE